METTLAAETRFDHTGKGAARKLRRSGRLPGIVYGRDARSTPVHVDPVTFQAIFRKTRDPNTILALETGDGEKVDCIVRDVQRHPLSREILHVDFYKLEEGQVIETDVPLRTVGKPKGATMGGRLRMLRRHLRVRCSYDKIPEALTYDVSPLEVGDFVRISEIPTPEGVETLWDQDFNVIQVFGKRTLIVEPEPEPAEAAAVEALGEEVPEGEEAAEEGPEAE